MKQDNKFAADEIMYNSILDGCAKQHRVDEAFRIVDDMSTQNGFRPNVQVYTCLVQACILNRRLDKALTLHETMLADEGCKVDNKFYAVLARGCLQLHQPLKAVEVVRAAFHLPGHSLALPTQRRTPPVGVEVRALEEVAAKLRAGSAE